MAPSPSRISSLIGSQFGLQAGQDGYREDLDLTSDSIIRVSANLNGQLGISQFVPAVSGGQTNVGDIKIGEPGVVQGRALLLSSISPLIITPLPLASVSIPGQGSDTADQNGTYTINDVNVGPYVVDASFSGNVPLPGGGFVFKDFFGSRAGNIDFNGDVEIIDFRFTSTGSANVTVQDAGGNPAPGAIVQFIGLGGTFGGGFVVPPDGPFFQNTDGGGMATFAASMGPCEVTVLDGFGNPISGIVNCFLNEAEEFLEVAVQTGGP